MKIETVRRDVGLKIESSTIFHDDRSPPPTPPPPPLPAANSKNAREFPFRVHLRACIFARSWLHRGDFTEELCRRGCDFHPPLPLLCIRSYLPLFRGVYPHATGERALFDFVFRCSSIYPFNPLPAFKLLQTRSPCLFVCLCNFVKCIYFFFFFFRNAHERWMEREVEREREAREREEVGIVLILDGNGSGCIFLRSEGRDWRIK